MPQGDDQLHELVHCADETDQLSGGLINHMTGTLFERLCCTSRSVRHENESIAAKIKIGGAALIAVWMLALSFSLAVWYSLISGVSAYLAFVK